MGAKRIDLNGLPDWPIMLSEEQAAAFVGLSAATFRAGRKTNPPLWPSPVCIGTRKLYHRDQLKLAADKLAGVDIPSMAIPPTPSPVNDRDARKQAHRASRRA